MKMILKSAKGQITIFFATTLLIVISFMAFIINIGIFVKAKINLQNAVDAAAFAGASVQARQLTNIAYLNWEMRNVYKEWMFKYYILGNLNIKDVAEGASGANTNLAMASNTAGSRPAEDKYNLPSVCIDFASAGGVSLCTLYKISGLPRFDDTAISEMDETLNTFLTTLVAKKGEDCAERSKLNYSTAVLWAYNVKTEDDNVIQSDAPQIASNRFGAFPKAFELAIRMRNLEAQVNKAPYTGVCYSSNSLNKNFCSNQIDDLLSGDIAASNERINKAFFSGFRNLGSESDTEMRASFTLTEVPPTPFVSDNDQSLSNLLIPASTSAREKFYLDLKLMTLNLATFYTMFTQSKGDINTPVGGNSQTTNTEGECSISKTGLPVPGYPVGFVKNPNVLTYYSVMGEAKFIGLFNPFDISGTQGIKLTAFAAAKPFGGRIGPKLFDVGKDSSNSILKPREPSGTNKFISSAYLGGIDLNNLVDQYGDPPADPSIGYIAGGILPLSISGKPFWQSDKGQAVGGWLDEGDVVFSVPNLVYDYPDNSGQGEGGEYFSQEPVQLISPAAPNSANAGLYNADIFNKFRSVVDNLGGNVSPDDVLNGILRTRAPTRYETNNYLIPTTEEFNKKNALDSFGLIPASNANDVAGTHTSYSWQLYAPLFSEDSDSLYKSAQDVLTQLQEFLEYQAVSIDKYIKSMNTTASAIYNDNDPGWSAGGNLKPAEFAAKIISDIPTGLMASNQPESPNAKPTCYSIAGKFAYFYLGADKASDYINTENCNPDATLINLMRTYLTGNQDSLGEYLNTEFVMPNDGPITKKLLTAYRPGDMNDANDGIFKNSIRAAAGIRMHRNFYSTKFITLDGLLPSPKEASASYTKGNFTNFSEGNAAKWAPVSQTEIINWMDIGKIGVELKNIKH
jgi:Flp pilus assembly protein TadG